MQPRSPSRKSSSSPCRGSATYVAGDAKERLSLSAQLVRPDGIVAWATDDEPDLKEAARAASRWVW
ncbi:MAG: hypothetical protein E5Y02_17305 [Mesorhizobium sp.]|nr:MAG: hypothetical protein E5Y02_17305 [Mesorhizobium sp.]